jgi:hypothetical protein
MLYSKQEPAIAFAKKGYHILLEKPMAVSLCLIYIYDHMNHGIAPELLHSLRVIAKYTLYTRN